MQKLLIIFIGIAILTTVACNKNEQKTVHQPSITINQPDSMIYGLACDGSNDSVLVLLKFSGEDPIKLYIYDARRNGKVFGDMAIGDWIGVLRNPADTTEAVMAIDLDQLKGTWTHQVMPTWKDGEKMSKRAIRNGMQDLSDSLRATYMIPREYGISLKRSSKASPVGYVRRTNSLSDDSPVEYPAIKNYIGWKCHNAHLILASTDRAVDNFKEGEKEVITLDTFEFYMMTKDSLVLRDRQGELKRFHRKENANTLNNTKTANLEHKVEIKK